MSQQGIDEEMYRNALEYFQKQKNAGQVPQPPVFSPPPFSPSQDVPRLPETFQGPAIPQMQQPSNVSRDGEAQLQQAIRELRAEESSQKTAKRLLSDSIDSDIDNLKSQLPTEDDANLFNAKMAKREQENEDQRKRLTQALEQTIIDPKQHKKESIARALIAGAASLGAAFAGANVDIYPILEAQADRTARMLAQNKEATIGLLSLNDKEREDILNKYKTRASFQHAIANSIRDLQKQKLEIIAQGNDLKSVQARIALGQMQARRAEKEADNQIQSAKTQKETTGFLQPESAAKFHPVVWASMDKKQQEDINNKVLAAQALVDGQEKLNALYDKAATLGFKNIPRGLYEGILKQRLYVINKLAQQGGLTEGDRKSLDAESPIEGLRTKESLKRQNALVQAWVRSIDPAVESAGGRWSPKISRFLYQDLEE